ncbi:MAG: cobalamin-binding protein [Deltaproteobacteria bacterium]|nr:cobalamin-binding protein [Deltaproteobacteria bacterium]
MKNHKTKTYFLLPLLILFFFPSAVNAEEYIDEVGRKVNIPHCPKRIVSLSPSITETLFALGLDKEIAGVTMFSGYPEAARSKPKVGSFINISLERVVSLNPDLVIGTADGNRKETVGQLERVGLPVYVVNPETFEEIFFMILDIGKITGREKEAKVIVLNLQKRIKSVVSLTKDLKKPGIFFQIGINPIVSVGRDTLHNKLIELAGGLNVTGDVMIKYPRCSIEDVIVKKPDIIIVSSMKRGEYFPRVRDGWKKWENIPAVKNDRIDIIESDLIDHSSPRIVDGLEKLAGIIHPEVSLKAN